MLKERSKGDCIMSEEKKEISLLDRLKLVEEKNRVLEEAVNSFYAEYCRHDHKDGKVVLFKQ